MDIVVLTQKKPSSYFLVNNFEKCNNYRIIVEDRSYKNHFTLIIKRYKRSVRSYGFLRGLLSTILFIFELPFIAFQNYKFSNFLGNRFKDRNFNYDEIFSVNNINDKKTINLTIEFNPKVVIVIGTSIIKKNVITQIKKNGAKIINWHAGVTPEYRGVKSEFYCVLNDEIDMVGSTIHYLDAGVDTGKIIKQRKINLDQSEKYKYNHAFLRFKNVLLALEMFNEILDEMRNNCLINEMIKSSKSKLYSTPRLKDYLKFYYLSLKNSL